MFRFTPKLSDPSTSWGWDARIQATHTDYSGLLDIQWGQGSSGHPLYEISCRQPGLCCQDPLQPSHSIVYSWSFTANLCLKDGELLGAINNSPNHNAPRFESPNLVVQQISYLVDSGWPMSLAAKIVSLLSDLPKELELSPQRELAETVQALFCWHARGEPEWPRVERILTHKDLAYLLSTPNKILRETTIKAIGRLKLPKRSPALF